MLFNLCVCVIITLLPCVFTVQTEWIELQGSQHSFGFIFRSDSLKEQVVQIACVFHIKRKIAPDSGASGSAVRLKKKTTNSARWWEACKKLSFDHWASEKLSQFHTLHVRLLTVRWKEKLLHGKKKRKWGKTETEMNKIWTYENVWDLQYQDFAPSNTRRRDHEQVRQAMKYTYSI